METGEGSRELRRDRERERDGGREGGGWEREGGKWELWAAGFTVGWPRKRAAGGTNMKMAPSSPPSLPLIPTWRLRRRRCGYCSVSVIYLLFIPPGASSATLHGSTNGRASGSGQAWASVATGACWSAQILTLYTPLPLFLRFLRHGSHKDTRRRLLQRGMQDQQVAA